MGTIAVSDRRDAAPLRNAATRTRSRYSICTSDTPWSGYLLIEIAGHTTQPAWDSVRRLTMKKLTAVTLGMVVAISLRLGGLILSVTKLTVN